MRAAGATGAATGVAAGGGGEPASTPEGVASDEGLELASDSEPPQPNLLREWAEQQRLNEPIIGATHGFARSAAEATRSRAQAMAKQRLGGCDID